VTSPPSCQTSTQPCWRAREGRSLGAARWLLGPTAGLSAQSARPASLLLTRSTLPVGRPKTAWTHLVELSLQLGEELRDL
jgi:hypothetical protein